MKYSIVIPTYNHCDDLLKPCITSIIRNTIPSTDFEIIVVANGCTDNTREYLDGLSGFNLKTLWFDESIGYTKATNEGIIAADPTSEYIILLNNDVILLDQKPNQWIEMLEQPFTVKNGKAGVTGPMKGYNSDTDRNFLIFFCVMIRSSVFSEIGLLDEIFSPGSGEDVDFCIRAENAGYQIIETGETTFEQGAHVGTGSFPIYHEGEKTVHDTNLVQNWKDIFNRNMGILSVRYGKKTTLPDGWFSEDDIKTYRKMFEDMPDGGIAVEIGTWKGRSLCSVADIIIRKKIQVIAVDTFEGTDSTPEEAKTLAEEAKTTNIEAIFRNNLQLFGLTYNVTITKGNSAEAYKLFKDKTFDLLFLDADHSYESVYNDIHNWFWKLKPHGIFAGHDFAWEQVSKAVKDTFGNNFEWNNMNLWWVVKPKIYDCFPFFNEYDLLEIRLNELNDIVDEFVLVESNLTFSGKPKLLYFDINKSMYHKFANKIVHITQLDGNTGTSYESNWIREEGQRDKIMEILKPKCRKLDVIISSDLDEIPRAESVRKYALDHVKDGIMLLDQKYAYYYLNNFTNDVKWQEGRIFPFYETQKYGLSQLRRGPTHHSIIPSLPNAGWHFSFLGDRHTIKHKIESFAHTELDTDDIKSENNINKSIKLGVDLFHRGNTTFHPCAVDNTFPEFVTENIQKYITLGYIKEGEESTIAMEKNIENNPIKLNLGCGNLTYPDAINIDLYNPNADVSMDIRKLEYPDNFADELIAYHVFEHLSPYESAEVLSEWLRVLKPQGKLIMELPNVQAMFADFEKSNKEERYRLLNCIYGTTQIEHPHLFGWYPEILIDHLHAAGYVDINVQPPKLVHHWGINFRIEAYKNTQEIMREDAVVASSNNSNISDTPVEKIKRNVFDTFLFFNELDILELRMNELYNVVDFFLIMESNKTFTGNDKPFYFDNNKEKFDKFKDKIINIKLTIPDNIQMSAWDMEEYQRNAIFTSLQDLYERNKIYDHDIVILSDVDEIPNPRAVRKYDEHSGISLMNQKLFYYYLNCLSDMPWFGSRIGTWGEIKNISATQLRNNKFLPIIENGGWHFSFIGAIFDIIYKIESYSHQEYNNPYFTDADKIKDKIKNCQDIFERPISFSIVDIDDTFPASIVNNKDYYTGIGFIHNK